MARAYNNAAKGDPNHRYAANPAVLQTMPGWVFEGLVMCLPPRSVVHVSASRGDDTNAGTRVAPLKTIQRGLDLAAANGLVFILSVQSSARAPAVGSARKANAAATAAIVVIRMIPPV